MKTKTETVTVRMTLDKETKNFLRYTSTEKTVPFPVYVANTAFQNVPRSITLTLTA